MKKLNKAYRKLLEHFDKLRENMQENGIGLCWLRRYLPDEEAIILAEDFYLQGLRSDRHHWKFTKASYDARRRWIERRIKETE